MIESFFRMECTMMNWFYNPNVNFEIGSSEHILTMAIITIIIVTLFLFRQPLTPYRRVLRLTVGWGLIFSRLSLDIWYIATNNWQITTSLPLELCSIATIMGGIMLITKNRFLFEVFYFIAIGGAIQAIITPDLNFGFPQFRFLQFFFDHMLLIISPIILIVFYQYHITFKSLIKSFVTLNVIALIVFIVNHIISANYMFLINKPQAGSLLDFLGPYPYYLISLEAVTFIIFLILYLPFLKKNLIKI